jgi:hypothetical protein
MTINQALYRDLYKNARMLVLLKLIFDLGGCATVVNLSKILGVHRDGISDNIYRLADRSLISRPHERSGWFITRLGMDFLKPSPQLLRDRRLDPTEEKQSILPENSASMPEKPALALTTTITTLNIEEGNDLEGEVERNRQLMSEKSAISPEKPAFAHPNLLDSLAEKLALPHRVRAGDLYTNSPGTLTENLELPAQDIRAEEEAFEDEVWEAFSELKITHNPTSEKVAITPGLTYNGVMIQWEKLKAMGKPWKGLLLQILPTLE